MSNYFSRQYQRWGLRKALYATLMAGLSKQLGLHVAILNTRTLGNQPEPAKLPAGYQLRILDQDDLDRASNQPELDISPDFLPTGLANGGYCAGAYHGNQLVSYIWRAYASTPIHDRLELCFEPPLRYGYKALTLPDHRGLHLQHAIALHTESKDLAQGYRLHLSFIETHNYPSIVSDLRRGNVVVGYLLWIDNRWINWAYVTKTARARNISVRLNSTGPTN